MLKKYRHLCFYLPLNFSTQEFPFLREQQNKRATPGNNVIVWWFLQMLLNILARQSERICIDSVQKK